MVELDRNDIPQLPHPVYAVVFERPDEETLRVSVQTSEGFHGTWTEFALDGAPEARIRSWLVALDYPFASARAWQLAVEEVAERAVAWARTAPVETDTL